MFSLLL